MTENESENISLLKAEIERLKKVEKNLRENEEKYRTIFNSLDQSFCIIEMIFSKVRHYSSRHIAKMCRIL